MTTRQNIAALLLTMTAFAYGAIPLVMDWNPTHVLHPGWPPHARFHMVWQLSMSAMLGALVLVMVWWPFGKRGARLKLAAVIGLIVLGGFVVAAFAQEIYSGAFSEQGSAPPVMGMDVNVLLFTPTIAIHLAACMLAFLPGRVKG
jgi:hypothetical protein